MLPRISRAAKHVARTAAEILADNSSEKIGVYLKLDRSVVAWFKRSGPGYQRRINEVLRRFVAAVSQEKTKLELAQELFEKYYEQCFWHMKPDLIITEAELPQLIKGLKMHGGREGYIEAARLCR
jgi:hypothetical protein